LQSYLELVECLNWTIEIKWNPNLYNKLFVGSLADKNYIKCAIKAAVQVNVYILISNVVIEEIMIS